MRVGLHNHTCYSDGRLSPETLISQAAALHYERLAITDHNSVAGWRSLGQLPDWVIPGIELSAVSENGTEVHLLGLDVQPEGRLLEHTETFQALYDTLWRDGVQFLTGDSGWAEQAFNPETRSGCIEHLCQTLGAHGAMRAWGAAHAQVYLEKLKPLIPHWREAIAWLHDSQAQVGLAHPQRYGEIADLAALLDSVDAVEVIHPDHPPDRQVHWRTEAQKRGKACWASHDFHGWSGVQNNGLLPPVEIDPHWLEQTG